MHILFIMETSDVATELELHFFKEEKVKSQLLILEYGFRDIYALMQKELVHQKTTSDRLWTLSQRYKFLMSETNPCYNCPEFYVVPAEDSLLVEFHEKLKLLRSSNCHVLSNLHGLRKSCRAFEKLCAELDTTMETPLILGDTFHRPLSYFIELVSDLFSYMHAATLKRKCWASLFDPGEPTRIQDYKALLEHSEEFEEYLNVGLTYCKCLRTKQKCDI